MNPVQPPSYLDLSLGSLIYAVSRFFEILDNIHVTIENFMDKARDFQNHEHVSMMGQIVPLLLFK